jgi:hypothetical protein
MAGLAFPAMRVGIFPPWKVVSKLTGKCRNLKSGCVLDGNFARTRASGENRLRVSNGVFAPHKKNSNFSYEKPETSLPVPVLGVLAETLTGAVFRAFW